MRRKKTVRVGDPWKSSDEPYTGTGCVERSDDGFRFFCCRPADHAGPHIAGNGTRVVAVWK